MVNFFYWQKSSIPNANIFIYCLNNSSLIYYYKNLWFNRFKNKKRLNNYMNNKVPSHFKKNKTFLYLIFSHRWDVKFYNFFFVNNANILLDKNFLKSKLNLPYIFMQNDNVIFYYLFFYFNYFFKNNHLFLINATHFILYYKITESFYFKNASVLYKSKNGVHNLVMFNDKFI